MNGTYYGAVVKNFTFLTMLCSGYESPLHTILKCLLSLPFSSTGQIIFQQTCNWLTLRTVKTNVWQAAPFKDLGFDKYASHDHVHLWIGDRWTGVSVQRDWEKTQLKNSYERSVSKPLCPLQILKHLSRDLTHCP